VLSISAFSNSTYLHCYPNWKYIFPEIHKATNTIQKVKMAKSFSFLDFIGISRLRGLGVHMFLRAGFGSGMQMGGGGCNGVRVTNLFTVYLELRRIRV
jgi:hypothetical protein